MKSAITNAMTIDVEDYFQVSALAPHFPKAIWESVPCRVERNVDMILDLLAQHNVKATFFTLGWIAERYPNVVKKIVAGGHELASHGYGHDRVSDLAPGPLLEDLTRSKKLLEDIGGVAINGYRAPSFSIGEKNLWALETIHEAGYRYSSSIYPIVHDHYGIPDAPRFKYRHPSGLIEIPITTVRELGRNWPGGGGGYFRFFPYPVSKWLINHVNRTDHSPSIFYFHPWEVDPEQPRVTQASAKSRFRHYINLNRMRPRLAQLLQDFKWGRVDEVFLAQDL